MTNIDNFDKYINNELLMIVGPVGSGKTTLVSNIIDYLIDTSNIDVNKIIYIKPTTDTRNDTVRPNPITHRICQITTNPNTLDIGNNRLLSYEYVCIDEIQFYSTSIFDEIKLLMRKGIHVIVSGLSVDYKMNPFSELVITLLCISDEVIKLSNTCIYCNSRANYHILKLSSDTAKAMNNDSNIVIESSDAQYLPVCSKCYYEHTDKVTHLFSK